MKEITVTYTAEVTRVFHLRDAFADHFIKEYQKDGERKVAARLRREMSADDVHIKDLKLFTTGGTL